MLNNTFQIPDGIIEDRSAVIIKSKKTLIISDLHLPYHSKIAVNAALTKGYEENVDAILINGDLIDFYQLSRFSKDPRKECVAEEIAMVKQFLTGLRNNFKRQQIYYTLGNHEQRLEDYCQSNATALIGLAGLEIQNLLELDKFKIRLVRDKRRVKIGNLNVLHGHEIWGIGMGVTPARSVFVKTKSHTLVGHTHKKSEYSENTLDGKSVVCFSTGCLCDLQPLYFPYNNWNHGFAIVTNDSTGHFQVNNYYVSAEGKVY